MRTRTKLKFLAGLAAIGTGAAWTVIALGSSGISQSIEVGGYNLFRGISISENINISGDAGIADNISVGGTANISVVRASTVDGGTITGHIIVADTTVGVPAESLIVLDAPDNTKTFSYSVLRTPTVVLSADLGVLNGLYSDSIQTYTGGSTAMSIGTTGTGVVTIGNYTGGDVLSGPVTIASSASANDLKLGAGGLTYLGATSRRRMSWQASTNADADFATVGQNVIGMAAATAVAGGGTCTPAADTTDDAYMFVKFPTDAASAGHACGRNSAFTIARATFLPSFSAVVRTDPSAVTSQTVFVGVAASSLDQITTLAGANGIRGCWFRHDTGLSDTTWKACSSDGTTASCTDTTITVAAATTYRLGIDNTTSGTCDYYVNGVRKVNKTSNISTSNTALGIEATITARASAARALSVSKVILEEN